MCFNGQSQNVQSESSDKHLIIYRTDINNFSSFKFMVNNQKFKLGTLSLWDFKVSEENVDLIIATSRPTDNSHSTKINFTANKNIYLRASIGMYGSNITEVSELTFLLETSNTSLKRETKEF